MWYERLSNLYMFLLCKVSCICSSYAFGFIRPNEILNMIEVMQRYECISLCISHHFEIWFALKNNIFLLSQKNNRLPIVLPLEHLNKTVMISYAWLQLFLFFHNPLWVKYAFFVPLNYIIKRYILCFPWNLKLFMNGNHIGGHGVNEYLWMYLWNV